MTKEQEESDGSVIPQGRRKLAGTVAVRRGGKGATASQEVGQLGLFRGTADSPQGVAEERDIGQPGRRPRSERISLWCTAMRRRRAPWPMEAARTTCGQRGTRLPTTSAFRVCRFLA
jgi:hypothetical protein